MALKLLSKAARRRVQRALDDEQGALEKLKTPTELHYSHGSGTGMMALSLYVQSSGTQGATRAQRCSFIGMHSLVGSVVSRTETKWRQHPPTRSNCMTL